MLYVPGSLFIGLGLLMGIVYAFLINADQSTWQWQQVKLEVRQSDFETEYQRLKQAVQQPYSDATEYFNTLLALTKLEQQAKKLDATEPLELSTKERPFLFRDRAIGVNQLLRDNSNRFHRRGGNFDYTEFEIARETFQIEEKKIRIELPSSLWKVKPVLLYFLIWQLFSAGILGFYFWEKIAEQDCQLLPELITGKFFAALLLWEVAFWYYPNTTPQQQWKSMMRFASLFASSIFSFGAFGAKVMAQVATPTPIPTTNSQTSGDKEESTIKVNAKIQFWPKYLGPNGSIFSKHPLLQQSIKLSANEWYIGAVFSKSMHPSHNQPNYGNQIYLFGGYSKKIQGIELGINTSYLSNSPIRLIKGDFFGVGATARAPTKTWKRISIEPTMSVNWFSSVNKKSREGGLLIDAGNSIGVMITKKFSISINPTLAYDNGAFGFNKTILGSANGNLSYKPNKYIKLQLGFQLSKPLTPVNDGRKFEWNVGPGFAFLF